MRKRAIPILISFLQSFFQRWAWTQPRCPAGGKAGQQGCTFVAGSMISGCLRIGSSRSRPKPGPITPIRQMGRKPSTAPWNALPSVMRNRRQGLRNGSGDPASQI